MPATPTDRLQGLTTSVAVKAPCRLKTTANHALAGLGAIDGVTPAEGDRVLVGSNTDATENGIYNASSGAWVRAKDFDGTRDAVGGTQVLVISGNDNSNSYWRVDGEGPVFIGTAEIEFAPAFIDDSATATFLPAGAGAVSRTVQAKLREYASVMDFGATGDGATDDLAAIQAALNTGKSVFFPAPVVDYKISGVLVPVDGQTISGEGAKSIIRQTGTDTGSTIFALGNKTGVRFENLHLKPGGTTFHVTDGFGVLAIDCDHICVTDCEFSSYRRGAVCLVNCTNSRVTGNDIHDSIVNPAVENSDDGSYEILILNSSANIRIEGNSIRDGGGFAIGVQSNTDDPQTFDTIAIAGNTIKGSPGYGIFVYAHSIADIWRSISITGNSVSDVSGALENSATSNYPFGCGIYVQGAEGVVVSGNALARTNINTDVESLAPGAIGFTNCRTGNITGNSILEPYWYGIFAGDPSEEGAAGGSLAISSNFVDGIHDDAGTPTKSLRDGIFVKDFPRACISANAVSNFGGSGIRAANALTSLADGFAITGNAALLNESSGIVVEDGDSLIHGNTAEGNGYAGIYVVGTGSHVVNNNRSTENLVYGFSAQASGDVEARGNIFKTNVSAHVSASVPIKGLADNFFGALVTISVGAYPIFTVLDNTGTPSVKNGTDFVTGGTTAITNFDDGTDAQEITVFSAHAVTITQGSTIKLNGSANFVMASGDTLTLCSRSGIWYEKGRMDS